MSGTEAKSKLAHRLLVEELIGYVVEDAVPVTGQEAAALKLPDGCVQLLG